MANIPKFFRVILSWDVQCEGFLLRPVIKYRLEIEREKMRIIKVLFRFYVSLWDYILKFSIRDITTADSRSC